MSKKLDTERKGNGSYRLGPEFSRADSKMLSKIVHHTMTAVEKSRVQIREIHEAAQRELVQVRHELERVKQAMTVIVKQIDELGEMERRADRRLEEVNRNITQVSEKDVRAAYYEINRLQIYLATAREKKQQLQWQNEHLLVRLRNLNATLDKTEPLIAQVGIVKGYMGTQMGGIVKRMESLEERQVFGSKVIKAQEDERRQVARKIHDGPTQYMANVVMRSEVCERLLDEDIDLARRELQEIRRQGMLCLQETRRIIFSLRPMTIDDLGLVPTIKRMLDTLREHYDLFTDLNIIGQEKRFCTSQEVGLFRLIQEALANVEKHSAAKSVTIWLGYYRDFISAVIEDNGVGFDSEVTGGEGFGLLGMRERAEMLGGEVLIKSKPAHGTKVLIKVPFVSPVKCKGTEKNKN